MHSPRLLRLSALLLLLPRHGHSADAADIPWGRPLAKSALAGESAGFTTEPFTNVKVGSSGKFSFSGTGRGYLTRNPGARSWHEVQFRRVDLRGRTLDFEVDMSDVHCSTLAAVYLVGMRDEEREDQTEQECD